MKLREREIRARWAASTLRRIARSEDYPEQVNDKVEWLDYAAGRLDEIANGARRKRRAGAGEE